MYSVLKRLLPVLAILAVGCMQVFGLQRGFICECGSKPKVIYSDHCNNVNHGDGCHEGDEDVPHDKEDHPDEMPSKEHASNKEDVTLSRVVGGQAVAPQPLLYVIACLEWLAPECVNTRVAQSDRELHSSAKVDECHWPRMLAHTIVLRV